MITELTKYGISHIGFVARDREEVVAKISTLFGVSEWRSFDFIPARAWFCGKEVTGHAVKVSMGVMVEGTCRIEVIEPLAGEGIYRDFLRSGRCGLHHFAFEVDDYPYWRDRFQHSGVDIIFEAEGGNELEGYIRNFYVQDQALGTIYEIMERPRRPR